MGEEEPKEEESMENTNSEEVIPESEKTPEEKKEEQTLKQAVKKLYKFTEKDGKEELKTPKRSFKERIINFYDTKYRNILFFTFAILILSIFIIGMQIVKTGDFVQKDISLSGGITITIFHEQAYDLKEVQNYLTSQFPDKELSARSLTQLGKDIGLIVEGTDIDADLIIASLEKKIGAISSEDYSVSMMGSSLGNTFFQETLKAMFVSFMFMGLVVFLYFGESLKIKIIATIATFFIGIMIFAGSSNIIKDSVAYILGAGLIVLYYKNSRPSFMMILSVFSDLVFTLAVVDLLGMKISTAGVASFLMIIGYCVETDILLTTKLIKKKEGSIIERTIEAFKTGIIMTLTAASAVLIALIFTQSNVIKEIMTILLIGFIADIIFTWGQNVGLLRIYLDKKSANNGLQH